MIDSRHPRRWLPAAFAAAALGVASVPVRAMDAAAAQTFARQSACFKCHAIDKRKDGPPYREVAAKYRGKDDAQATLLHHLTSGRAVTFPDGHEESHKILTAPREDIENLIEWLLSL